MNEDRTRMEEEMAAIQEALESPGMPGLKGNLVDENDFP